MQKVCTQTNLLTPWCELAWNCWACASQSRLMSTAPFYGPVSPAYSGRKNVYFFRTREVLLLGPCFAVGFYCGDVWNRICWARLFGLAPCSLTPPQCTCRLQTVNACAVHVQTRRQCTTRVANCSTQKSNRSMHVPARCVLTSHACGTAASWASCQSLGGRVGKRPVLEARRVQKVCTQANLLTPWRELAWNC